VSLQSRIQVAGQDGTEVEAGQDPNKAAAPERASVVSDPFADLKTRVHKDIIARLGPRLFNSESGKGDGDLEAAVNEAVTEVLALEKTPLTRQERQDIIRQISDDILG
jgi:pilus assembly protein CpaF